jgi:hypothetical protein
MLLNSLNTFGHRRLSNAEILSGLAQVSAFCGQIKNFQLI